MIMPVGLGAMAMVGVELVLRNIAGLINPNDPCASPPTTHTSEQVDAL